jgi:hypothetical protein
MTAHNSFSEYKQAARQKWPTADIIGDGPYALFCPFTDTVYLYSFAMAAMADIARDHGNWSCKDSHRMVELTPAPPRPVIRNRALMERD